jgi:gamma-glutamyltranspeptidase/glutathione hydrolase
MYLRIITFILLLAFIHPTLLAKSNQSPAAVAMPDSYSADVASQILKNGGNAIDAAVAAQFVLAVTLPEAGNIAGGGFMLIVKDGQSDFLDYRETAPAKAHRDMYLDDKGEVIPNLSVYGVLSAGVPGTVDGMWQAHQKYGSKSWAELVQPAIDLAEKGFVVHPKLADSITNKITRFSSDEFKAYGIWVNFADYFAGAKANATFKQPELAESLKRIAKQGRDGFYQGKTAQLIVALMKARGGLIAANDLANYQSVWRTPLKTAWRDMTILTAPPPSSGGIAIVQWLNMYDLTKTRLEGDLVHNSSQYIHVLAEAGKRVFADRAEYLGDPDFVEVPVDKLIDPKYIASRASAINLNSISDSEKVVPGLAESMDTTHFSIVDQWGNAVSNTTTLNISFGSAVVVPGGGFLLNDEMDDFSAKAGVANTYGALGGDANAIQANKRMLSSMTPTILLQDNAIKLVTGSPGGTTIITSVYQSILNVLDFDLPAQQAVDVPRFHHQLYPENTIWHHAGLDEKTTNALTDLGYELGEFTFGDLHIIVADGESYDTGSQASGRGKSMVFIAPTETICVSFSDGSCH